MISHGYLVSGIAFDNPACPFCKGVSPSTDNRTRCGWCTWDETPSVVPRDD